MLLTLALSFVAAVHGTQLFDRNLAYRSPFIDHPQLAHDTRSIQKRYLAHVRRQVQDATPFSDEHYPTFYGSDFSNFIEPVCLERRY